MDKPEAARKWSMWCEAVRIATTCTVWQGVNAKSDWHCSGHVKGAAEKWSCHHSGRWNLIGPFPSSRWWWSAPDYYSQSPTRRDASSPSSCMAGHAATQSTGRPLLKLAANHHLHRTIFSKHEYSSKKRIVWQTQVKLAIVKVSFKNENWGISRIRFLYEIFLWSLFYQPGHWGESDSRLERHANFSKTPPLQSRNSRNLFNLRHVRTSREFLNKFVTIHPSTCTMHVLEK